MAEIRIRNMQEELRNTITMLGEGGKEYTLKAGDDMNSLILNGKEVDTFEETKIAVNIIIKAMTSMVGGY